MEEKKCPRCGETMEWNPIVLDYVCDHCQYLGMDTMERMAEEYERDYSVLDAIERHKDFQSVKRMVDRVED